jgi:tRNA(Ile)-lysidine synthase
MAAVERHYLRPFLGLRRATTQAACLALGLPAWTDPHNADPAFQRVRLRGEVLPLLEDVLQGGVAEALARTADLLRDDLAALDTEAERVLQAALISRPADRNRLELDIACVANLPRALRTRVLRAWAVGVGAAPLTAERTAALDALVTDWHGQGPVDLPGGVGVYRRSGTLVVYPNPSRAAQE